MTKKLDEQTERAVRADARGLEATADTADPYPEGTTISRPNRPSRMFNLRLTDEQFRELHALAHERHLPMSTLARSWLLERLDHERRAS
ncbi:CopG family transcriptional regulator [Pseudonocardia spinosispora]|uniref:CopG family transcriptional regulator n=1 Tax=Pseudonocardia spinosispora TaxID=103441 RepID=UPI0012EB3888|nr:CopG family transcriptional regulator [Pseudonocardia spinosispora]